MLRSLSSCVLYFLLPESMTTILDSIRQAQSAPPPSGPPVTSDNPVSNVARHDMPSKYVYHSLVYEVNVTLPTCRFETSSSASTAYMVDLLIQTTV